MKFVSVTRFCEMNPMMRSIFSSKILKITRFATCTIATIYRFSLFRKKFKFTQVLHISTLPTITLMDGVTEHQPRNVNLQKGDLEVVCQPRSPMIKLAQDGEE